MQNGIIIKLCKLEGGGGGGKQVCKGRWISGKKPGNRGEEPMENHVENVDNI